MHTPGTWAAVKRTGCVYAGHTLVAVCDQDHVMEDDEQRANMALIAAAPDLLQALKACLNYMENTESSFGITLDSADKARAAIAKAIAKAEIRK